MGVLGQLSRVLGLVGLLVIGVQKGLSNGQDGGQIFVVFIGGSNGVGLWREFNRVVGNWESTNFWGNCWVGEVSLKNKFSRLFRIIMQKSLV